MDERELVEQGESNYHQIKRVMKARNNCLRKIKAQLEAEKNEHIERTSQLEKYCSVIAHLRLLTILLIEKVEEWRKAMVEMQLRSTTEGEFNSVEITPIVF